MKGGLFTHVFRKLSRAENYEVSRRDISQERGKE
jgi:hypothetical protein